MQRTKENEQSDLEKKYSTILQAPRAALWMGFPPNVALPNDAIQPQRNSTARKQPTRILNQGPTYGQGQGQGQRQGQGFPICGRGGWHPTHGRGRARYNPTQRPRNPNSMRRNQTIQQVVTLLGDLFSSSQN